jgi:hypothetical protein
LPDSENWAAHTILINRGDYVRVDIDIDKKVRLRTLDAFGSIVPGVELGLIAFGRELIKATTDQEGRAEIRVEADTEYFVQVMSMKWTHARIFDQPKVRASAISREILLRNRVEIQVSCSAVGFDAPPRIGVLLYGKDADDWLGETSIANPSPLPITENVKRLVVIEPGCLAEEILVNLDPSDARPLVRVELKRGPTVVGARTTLPRQYTSPLRARAQALKVYNLPARDAALQKMAMKKYSSEFAPTDGDIIFGPLSPGKYSLEIVDATGGILWEETREVR